MNTLTYSQKIGNWLLKQSGCSLLDFCQKFKYYPLAIKIMNLDETNVKAMKSAIARDSELKDLYLSYDKDKKAKSLRGENRSWTQYFKDLITGWVLEDLFLEMVKQQGIDIRHNGKDAQREISRNGDVSQNADFVITVGDVERHVELTSEFNCFLEKDGFIEKRAPALYHLWENKGIWLYRDIRRGKYVLTDFATEHIRLHLRSHNTSKSNWDKDVHRYVLSENHKKERNDNLLIPEIITVVGCSIQDKEQPPLDEVEDVDSPPHVFTIGGKIRSLQKTSEPLSDVPAVSSEDNLEDNPVEDKSQEEESSVMSSGWEDDGMTLETATIDLEDEFI